MNFLLVLGVAILPLWAGGTYLSTRSIESPSYSVVSVSKGFELRDYDPYIVAEVTVEGDYKHSINQGFRILAGYIFGGNVGEARIDMTAPVTETSGQKIEMTAPVTETTIETSHLITFTMPKQYTLETLPKPLDDSIQFREVSKRRLAVMSFTWNASAQRVEAKKEQLLKLVLAQGYQILGEPTYAGFTAPFSFPLLKKHEIWIEVVPR